MTIPTDTPAGQGELREELAREMEWYQSRKNTRELTDKCINAVVAILRERALLPGPDAGLVEALVPFAERARDLDAGLDPSSPDWLPDDMAIDDASYDVITVGDCRRAASALSAHKEGKNPPEYNRERAARGVQDMILGGLRWEGALILRE